MRRNAGDNMTLRIEDKKPLPGQKISQELLDQSALDPDVVAQVLAQMADAAAATDVPPQVADTSAGPAQDQPARPSRGAPTRRDPNSAFRDGRPRKRR